MINYFELAESEIPVSRYLLEKFDSGGNFPRAAFRSLRIASGLYLKALLKCHGVEISGYLTTASHGELIRRIPSSIDMGRITPVTGTKLDVDASLDVAFEVTVEECTQVLEWCYLLRKEYLKLHV